ncbi:MAG: DUF2232 domain-containing protein [Syntrophomonadaceae bacterium]|nr:DUF2232 domain-containing protein [Syntrophomonadaceae bacterium]
MVWRSLGFVGLSGEQEEVIKSVELFGYLLALAVLGIGLIQWPELANVWIILVITALTLAGSRGSNFMLLLAVVVIVMAVSIAGAGVIPFLLVSIIPGIAMGYAVACSASLGWVVTGGFIAGIIGFFLTWAWQFGQDGLYLSIHPIEAMFANYFQQMLEFMKTSGFDEYYDAQGLNEVVLSDIFAVFLRSLEKLRPALHILSEWIKIILALLSARVLLSKKGAMPSPSFIKQKMAWQLDWIIILGLVMWLAGQHWQFDLIKQGGSNLLLLMIPIVLYFGMSLVVYLYQTFNIRLWIKVVLLLLILAMPFQALLFIAVLGMFDPLIDYRNLDGERGSPA